MLIWETWSAFVIPIENRMLSKASGPDFRFYQMINCSEMDLKGGQTGRVPPFSVGTDL